MTTLYTIDDHGEITSGLTAVEAASILLRDDGCQYEIRAGERCIGTLKGYGHYYLWTRQQVANRPWTQTVISVIERRMSRKVEEAIAEKVIASGHWEKGEMQCHTDEQHAAMMTALAVDEATQDAWYLIGGNNLQAIYGYGTADESDRYCDLLNEQQGRDINLYRSHLMTAEEIAALPHIEDEGFNLGDELSFREER